MFQSIFKKIFRNKAVKFVLLIIHFVIDMIAITYTTFFKKNKNYEYYPENNSEISLNSKFDSTFSFGSRPELSELMSNDPFLKIEHDWTTFNGFRAIVVNNTLLNIRTGYVGVAKDSFLYGKSHEEHVPELMPYIDDIMKNPLGRRSPTILLKYRPNVVSMIMVFNVINGITHNCGGLNSSHPIESDLWWLTFKCINIKVTQIDTIQSIEIEPIGDLEFCVDECENLASQIKEAELRYLELDKKVKDQIDQMIKNS